MPRLLTDDERAKLRERALRGDLDACRKLARNARLWVEHLRLSK